MSPFNSILAHEGYVTRNPSIILRRVRVRGEFSNAVLARIRISACLDTRDLTSRSTPDRSLLVVRKLADPLPGMLNFEHPTAGLESRWQRAFESGVENLSHHAVHPLRESVPANAEAILFKDRSELLACLAIDWLAGELVAHWWWKCLFPNADLGRLAVTAWLEAPESVPAALGLLASHRKLPEFVRRISGTDCIELIQKLVFTFGLQSLRSVPEEIATTFSIQEARVVHSDSRGEIDPVRSVEPDLRAPPSRIDPPWRPWVAESGLSAIGPYRQLLAGVGLMLHRAPAIVRTQSFAGDVLRWVRSLSSVSSTIAGVSESHSESNQTVPEVDNSIRSVSTVKNSGLFHRGSAPGDHQPQERENNKSVPDKTAAYSTIPDLIIPAGSPTSALSAISGTADDSSSTGGAPIGRTKAERRDEPASSDSIDAEPPIDAAHATREEERSEISDGAPPMEHGKSNAAVQQVEEATQPDVWSTSVQDSRSRAGAPMDSQTHRLQPSAPAVDLQPPALSADMQPAALAVDRIETKLGGLFYLINAGLALNLYADFTRPLEPGLDLPIWDFIELVGRRLLTGKSKRDPVWTLLARLAGRKGEEPGRFFEPPEEWRVPPDWLVPFQDESVWNWSTSPGRLRVRHPEGFYVVDVGTTGNVEKQLHEEMLEYEGVAGFTLRQIASHMVQDVPKLDHWLGWFVPFLSARLRRGMRLDRRKNPANVLLKHHARVEAVGTRLDIYLSLDELPIQVRIAGLDRDPGWVPAAGRYVAFHYD